MRLLSRKEVREKVSLSFAHIARLEAEKRFPRRVPLTGATNGRVAWLENEVDDWIRDRVARRTS